MNCLNAADVYRFLEDDLLPEQKRRFRQHLASCAKCRKALEDRRLLIEAAESLPSWEVPSEFAGRITARLFPRKTTARDWLTALAVGFSAAAGVFIMLGLFGGHDPARLFVEFNHSALSLGQDAFLFLIKTVKVLSLGLEILFRLLSAAAEAFLHMTGLVRPEIQAAAIIVSVVFALLLAAAAKKKSAIEEIS